MGKLRILLVCTGNICRSPSAEAVLRQRLAGAGLAHQVEVDSAGTHDWHSGEPADPRAVSAGAARGYDLTPLRARAVSARDFVDCALILAMDRGHRRYLETNRPPDAQARIRLLLDYAAGPIKGGEVPDPYYGDTDDFAHMLDLIEQAADGLIDALRRDVL